MSKKLLTAAGFHTQEWDAATIGQVASAIRASVPRWAWAHAQRYGWRWPLHLYGLHGRQSSPLESRQDIQLFARGSLVFEHEGPVKQISGGLDVDAVAASDAGRAVTQPERATTQVLTHHSAAAKNPAIVLRDSPPSIEEVRRFISNARSGLGSDARAPWAETITRHLMRHYSCADGHDWTYHAHDQLGWVEKCRRPGCNAVRTEAE